MKNTVRGYRFISEGAKVMQSKTKTTIVTGEYRRIKDLLKHTTSRARQTLLKPELHITHLNSKTKAGYCMYPDWWGHEEYSSPYIVNHTFQQEMTRPSGLPTPQDPPPKVIVSSYPKRMVDEIVQTDLCDANPIQQPKPQVETSSQSIERQRPSTPTTQPRVHVPKQSSVIKSTFHPKTCTYTIPISPKKAIPQKTPNVSSKNTTRSFNSKRSPSPTKSSIGKRPLTPTTPKFFRPYSPVSTKSYNTTASKSRPNDANYSNRKPIPNDSLFGLNAETIPKDTIFGIVDYFFKSSVLDCLDFDGISGGDLSMSSELVLG